MLRASLGKFRKPEEGGAGGISVSSSGGIQMKESSFREQMFKLDHGLQVQLTQKNFMSL